jgi:hypothetical protein
MTGSSLTAAAGRHFRRSMTRAITTGIMIVVAVCVFGYSRQFSLREQLNRFAAGYGGRRKPNVNIRRLQITKRTFPDAVQNHIRAFPVEQKPGYASAVPFFVFHKLRCRALRVRYHDPLGFAEVIGKRRIGPVDRHHHCDFSHENLPPSESMHVV